MKKTIAILLILVIGMVGVFADDTPTPTPTSATADVKITTDITPQSLIRITSVEYNSTAQGMPTTYASFDSWAQAVGTEDGNAILVTATDLDLNGDDASGPDTIGNLTYYTNKPTGLSVTFAATPLADNVATGGVSTIIKYTVTVGGKTATAGTAKGNAGTSSDSLTLVATGATGVTMGSKPITVYLDSTDYALAAVASSKYIGTITFSYISD